MITWMKLNPRTIIISEYLQFIYVPIKLVVFSAFNADINKYFGDFECVRLLVETTNT